MFSDHYEAGKFKELRTPHDHPAHPARLDLPARPARPDLFALPARPPDFDESLGNDRSKKEKPLTKIIWNINGTHEENESASKTPPCFALMLLATSRF